MFVCVCVGVCGGGCNFRTFLFWNIFESNRQIICLLWESLKDDATISWKYIFLVSLSLPTPLNFCEGEWDTFHRFHWELSSRDRELCSEDRELSSIPISTIPQFHNSMCVSTGELSSIPFCPLSSRDGNWAQFPVETKLYIATNLQSDIKFTKV